MYSILNYNKRHSHLFIPNKENNRQNSDSFLEIGKQSFYNGMEVKGVFTEGKLNGKFQLSFKHNKTTVKGIAKENRLKKGLIEFDTGVRVEGEFQNNGHYDLFKKVKITLKSGFNLICQYNIKGSLLYGILVCPNSEVVSRFKDSKIVYYYDCQRTKGLILEKEYFYEGEIKDNEKSGSGVIYYPIGLIYYRQIASRTEPESMVWKNFCFIGSNQFISNSKLKKGKLVEAKKVYSNGITESIYECQGKTVCSIDFEKLSFEGHIVSESNTVLDEDRSKGCFHYNKVALDIEYFQQDLTFYVCYKNIKYSLEEWFDFFKTAFSTAEQKLESSRRLSSTLKKISSQEEFLLKKSAKEADDQRMLRLANLERIKQRESYIKAKNRKTFLLLELEKKEREINEMKKKRELGSLSELSYFQGTLIKGKKEGHCIEIDNENRYTEACYRDGVDINHKKRISERAKQMRANITNMISSIGKGEEGLDISKTETNSISGSDQEEREEVIIIYSNDWEFKGNLKKDRVLRKNDTGTLTNGKRKTSISVIYSYVADLKCFVFVDDDGNCYDADSGELKKLLCLSQ